MKTLFRKILILISIALVGIFAGSSTLSPFSNTNNSHTEQISFAQTVPNATSYTNTSSLSSVNSTNISIQQPYAFFIVLRLGNDTESSYDFLPIHKVDSQVMSRHTELQKGMQSEDARIVKLASFCQTYHDYCNTLKPRPYTAPYSTWIDHLATQSMLSDSDLQFHNSPSLPSNFKETQVDVNGIVYSIGVQCKVEGCN